MRSPTPSQSGSPTKSFSSRKRRPLPEPESRLARCWKSLPRPADVAFDLRYCNFQRRCKIFSAACLGLSALILFILAGTLPSVVVSAWQDGWTDRIVLADASEWGAAPKVGRSFGGSSSDTVDEGVQVEYQFANIINPDKVLRYGARPIMTARGPYSFREYRQRHNVSVSGAVASYTERRFHVHTFGTLSDTITVPNPAYQRITSLLKNTPAIRASSFEEGILPLLFAHGMREVRDRGPFLVKRATWAALVEAALLRVVNAMYGGSKAALLAVWRSGGREDPANNATAVALHPFVLPFAAGSTIPSIPSRVAFLVWSWGDEYSITNPSKWEWYLTPPTETRVALWAARFALVDALYADVAIARQHILLIASWIRSLLGADDESSGAAVDPREEQYDALLADLAFAENLIDAATWEDAFAGQVASSALTGLALKALSDRMSGPIRNVSEAAGPFLLNQCPQAPYGTVGGSSAFDYAPNQDNYDVPIAFEFSCWLARSVLSTQSVYFSRLSSTDMRILLEYVTQGPTISGFSIPGSLGAWDLLLGARRLLSTISVRNAVFNVASAPGGLFDILADFRTAQDTIASSTEGSPEAESAQAALRFASTAYRQHMESSDVRQNDNVCNLDFVPISLRNRGISCYELLDFANYIEFFARDFVYFPRFVWKSEDGRVDPSILRSGPLVRLRVEELLYGFEDRLFVLLRGHAYPGLGLPQQDDEDAWDSSSADVISEHTGADGLGQVGEILAHNDLSVIETWSEATEVRGNARLRQVVPTLDRSTQATMPEPAGAARTLVVWHETLRRPTFLDFAGTAASKESILNLWRFRMRSAVDFALYTRADKNQETPFCLRALNKLPDAAGEDLGIELFLGKALMMDCDASTLASAYSKMPSTSNLTDNSIVEVEPTTGTVTRVDTRESFFLRWRSSNWYPYLRPTIGLLFNVHRVFERTTYELGLLRDDIDEINYQADVAVPAACAVLGVGFFFGALLMAYVIIRPPKVPKRRKRRVQTNASETSSQAEDPDAAHQNGRGELFGSVVGRFAARPPSSGTLNRAQSPASPTKPGTRSAARLASPAAAASVGSRGASRSPTAGRDEFPSPTAEEDSEAVPHEEIMLSRIPGKRGRREQQKAAAKEKVYEKKLSKTRSGNILDIIREKGPPGSSARIAPA